MRRRKVEPCVLGTHLTTRGFTAALATFGMVACAGLPSMRDEARALIGAFGQGFGCALVAGSSMLVLLLVKAAGPSSGICCLHESRWPLGEPTAPLVSPSVLAGLLMVVAALLVRRIHWWVRAVVPALVWVAALVVQHAVWSP